MIPNARVKKAIEVRAGDDILYHRKWVKVRYVDHDWVDQYYHVLLTLVNGDVLSLPADNTVELKPELSGQL